MDGVTFAGRVAVVTGAGGGLGRAHARLLAERGAKVVVNDIGLTQNISSARNVVAEISERGGEAVADVHDVETEAGTTAIIQTALDSYGRIDIVVGNAAVRVRSAFTDCERADLTRLMEVNVGGTWGVTQAAWPHMCERGYGRVVVTTSGAGLFGSQQNVAYAASKSALIGMMRSLAFIGAPSGIMVNALSPGAWTPSFAAASAGADADRRAFYEENWPPELVSPVVAALCHERCPITGEIISAIGGHISRVFVAETVGMDVDGDFSAEYFLNHLGRVIAERGYHVPGAKPVIA